MIKLLQKLFILLGLITGVVTGYAMEVDAEAIKETTYQPASLAEQTAQAVYDQLKTDLEKKNTEAFLNKLNKLPYDLIPLVIEKKLDKYGHTLFHTAARLNNVEVIKALAERTNIDLPNRSEDTPLIIAAEYGKLEALNTLLDLEADSNVQTEFGITPLNRAATFNHADAIPILIDRGANVDLKNNQDKTALDIATEMENSKAIEALRAKGATKH